AGSLGAGLLGGSAIGFSLSAALRFLIGLESSLVSAFARGLGSGASIVFTLLSRTALFGNALFLLATNREHARVFGGLCGSARNGPDRGAALFPLEVVFALGGQLFGF